MELVTKGTYMVGYDHTSELSLAPTARKALTKKPNLTTTPVSHQLPHYTPASQEHPTRPPKTPALIKNNRRWVTKGIWTILVTHTKAQ